MRYNKGEVLSALRENRQAHKTTHRQARSVWRDEVIARYERALNQFETGVFKNAANPLIRYPRPKHHLSDYDAAIQRVEQAVADRNDSVHLSQREYERYVLNKGWDWDEDFQTTKSKYAA